jgi:hypothetical protein
MNNLNFPEKQEEVTYSLYIQNPKNPNIGDTIQFENREKMDSYIVQEAHYTRNELKALYRSISKSERDKAKDNLIKARFSFLSQVIKITEEENNEAG